MAQIGNIPEIIEVKEQLDRLKNAGLVKVWELPYENLLTRRSAAIFFLTPADESKCDEIWKRLSNYENFSYRENTERKLSDLKYTITFSQEDEFGAIHKSKD